MTSNVHIHRNHQRENNDNNNGDKNSNLLTKTASLLIHAAKIDDNYTEKEKSYVDVAINMENEWWK